MQVEFRGLTLVADATGKTNLTEQAIANVTAPSSEEWQRTFQAALIREEEVAGLKILDVGGGASDFTARLLELGADAYAIDPKYARMSLLKEHVRKNNSYYNTELLAVDFKTLNKALERFKQSSMTHRDRYKAAFASAIPFPDNTFDIVFSQFAILGYLNVDISVLQAAAEECLRVTKPSGTVRLFPFKEKQLKWDEAVNALRMKNDHRLLEHFQQRADVESVTTQVSRSKGNTLVIQKRSAAESDTILTTPAPLA